MLKGLARWLVSPSHHLVTQTIIDLWVLPHPMKYHKHVDMMNTMKYDTNKRWVIHNSKRNLTLKWLVDAKINVDLVDFIQTIKAQKPTRTKNKGKV
jgi:hypothetical protein